MTVVVDERIAERRREIRAERRRRRLRRTIATAVLLAVAIMAFLVERSDLVALQEVRVEGTVRLDPDDVIAAADLPLGTSTLRLRLGDAEDRVEELPLVLSADAWRSDPLTVTVAVVERRPILTIVGASGPVLVDETGQVIDEGRVGDLPRVQLDGATPDAGSHVSADPGLGGAFDLMGALPGPLRARVGRYVVDADDELWLRLQGGIRVRIGEPERLPEKARSLGAVLEDVGDTAVSLIDVRAPSAPTVRP